MTAIRATWRTRELLGHLLNGETYGYRIAKATGRAPSSVYVSLKQLADEGWVESGYEEDPQSSGPARRVYSLTVLGRLHAERLRDEAAASISEAEAVIECVRHLAETARRTRLDSPAADAAIQAFAATILRALNGTTPTEPQP